MTTKVYYHKVATGAYDSATVNLDYVFVDGLYTGYFYSKNGVIAFDEPVEIDSCAVTIKENAAPAIRKTQKFGSGFTIADGKTMQLLLYGEVGDVANGLYIGDCALYFAKDFTFESASFGEGRILVPESGGLPDKPYTYEYFLTDHLGSTRMVINDEMVVKEAVMYQPYGTMVPVKSLADPLAPVREKFTTKEFDTDGAAYGVADVAFTFNFPLYSDDPQAHRKIPQRRIFLPVRRMRSPGSGASRER